MATEPVRPQALTALGQLLSPAIDLLLELGVGVGDFERLIQKLYVDAAQRATRAEDAERGPSPPPPIARIAMLTGLTRNRVAELLKSGAVQEAGRSIGRHRAERVISGWLHDPHFHDDRTGAPAVLRLRGAGATFAALVRRYSGDPRVRTILTELKRVQAVRQHLDGRVELVRTSYAPSTFDGDALGVLGESARDYIRTLVYNIRHPHLPLYSRRVVNQRFQASGAPKVLRDLAIQGEAAMEKVAREVHDPSVTLGARARDADGARCGAAFFMIYEALGEHDQASGARPKVHGTRKNKAGRRHKSRP
ncbi:MAG TPA: DUF6502 family protein [Steroidobacteraceae bacterium]|nr:DUF6502 family protein [Steroidobacteraceae bacterium]